MEKDYSLLRPFDLEAAKRGEKIMWSILRSEVEFVGDSTSFGCVAYKEADGRIGVVASCDLRMAPLCWVEGKPVYKGDVLYSTGCFNGQHRVDEIRNGNEAWTVSSNPVEDGYFPIAGLTWTPPKVKREVRLLGYRHAQTGKIALLEQHPNPPWDMTRIESLDTTIEVEE